MIFEFKHTDDYELIISHEAQRRGEDFRALVDKYFSNGDDLLFSILEMVTLNDIDAIGETYLYSTYSKKESKEVLSRYKKIVNKVISNFENSIPEYIDWYRRRSYILIDTNQVEYSYPFQIPSWEQESSTVESSLDRSKFGKQIETHLDEKLVKDYLQYYGELLHEELNFKNYPNYCIIIRPISVIEGKDIIPLGNLFLHFATMKKHSEEFYIRLINDFLIVWFKNKGVQIIREIQEKAVVDDINLKDATKLYLPNFSNLRGSNRLSSKLKFINYSIKDYYDDLFNNQKLKDLYLEKCERLKVKSIPLFIELKKHLTIIKNNGGKSQINKSEYISFNLLPPELGYNGDFFGIQGSTVLSQKYDLEYFQKILLRRDFFKIGFLVFDIKPHILKNILMNTSVFQDSQSPEADYAYLWTEMFIPWSKSAKYSEIRTRICNSLSSVEKKFIESCRDQLSK